MKRLEPSFKNCDGRIMINFKLPILTYNLALEQKHKGDVASFLVWQ